MLDFFCRYGDLASVCVLHTLYDLRVRGYEVVAPHDLVETYDALGHGAGGINGFDVAHIRGMLHATVT